MEEGAGGSRGEAGMRGLAVSAKPSFLHVGALWLVLDACFRLIWSLSSSGPRKLPLTRGIGFPRKDEAALTSTWATEPLHFQLPPTKNFRPAEDMLLL
jgi:hypothetical protein